MKSSTRHNLASLPAGPDRRRWPGEIPWRYSVSEMRADAVVHAMGLAFAVVALVLFMGMPPVSPAETMAVTVYLAALVSSLAMSALYNLWPVSRGKWILRRFDHSAIYLLIAGTYTPFMTRLGTWWLLWTVWAVAALGIALKLLLAGRLDGVSIVLYLALGWSGVVLCNDLFASFSSISLWLIGIGGLVYSVGVIFHLWERLPFQNAIWHVFVLTAAMVHFGAVWSVVYAVE
ncbi:PAQR family membrane homeostasis protein TrhA [Lichenifustis flavocetrariae]|uniref:Hemolysin III family protein n=1 Tax=Lichenifustis flavocetrariae TaxID=2949735 RepID=A0AA42CI01_9HYPH|nr:hemolysin III family protein [Lichenifustis flavocetrariae]MCW6508073.1 hemolysin III family protein [Lichenifustis flavocetrariae]